MQTFKRTPFNIIKNFMYTLLGPVGAGIILSIILSSFTSMELDTIYFVSGGVSVLIFFMMGYSLLIFQAVSVEVSDHEIRYYQKKKLKGTYPFNDYTFGYRTVQQGNTTDTIDLQVINLKTGEEVKLDCEPLGPSQFQRMFALIESKMEKEPVIELEVEA